MEVNKTSNGHTNIYYFRMYCRGKKVKMIISILLKSIGIRVALITTIMPAFTKRFVKVFILEKRHLKMTVRYDQEIDEIKKRNVRN
jgi:hypothetical protein